MAPGKCPKCDKSVFTANVYAVDARRGPSQMPLQAVSLNCPNCHAVLGITIDPLVIKSEAVAEVVKEIRKQAQSQASE